MKPFIEVRTDYIDENGVIHIDGYNDLDENSEGKGIGYFIHGEVYWRDAEYQFDPLVAEVVKELKAQPRKFVLDNIDYAKLRVQKQKLLYVADDSELSDETKEELQGIVNLIDSLQDYAVDVMGKPESEVFNLNQE